MKPELKEKIEDLREKCQYAVSHVGAANYNEREAQAHIWVDNAFDQILKLLKELS